MEEEMAIELPKDAKGREIPLDTRRLYDEDGERKTVFWFVYSPTLKHWMVILDEGPDGMTCAMSVSHFRLIQPDSWEALEEDLDRVASCGESGTPACAYARQPCAVCKFHSSENCTSAVCADIASRIRKLRGDGK